MAKILINIYQQTFINCDIILNIEREQFKMFKITEIQNKTIYDYNDLCFDFEVLPNFWCVSFLQAKNKQPIDRYTFQSYPNDSQKTYLELIKLISFIKTKAKDNIFIA